MSTGYYQLSGQGYGNLPQFPVQSPRSPTTLDITAADGSYYVPGQGWINFNTQAFYIYDGEGIWSIQTGSPVTSFVTNSGTAVPAVGVINDLGSGSLTTFASGNTITTALTGLTNHNVLIGAGTATITKVAPVATTGIALVSEGVAADPAFGIVVPAGGGTGTDLSGGTGIVQVASGVFSASYTVPSTVTIQQDAVQQLILDANSGANGATLKFIGNGGVTPNKYIRVQNGGFQIINSALNASLFTLTDAGVISVSTWNGATITVPYGGTGDTSFTAYMPITGGTTSTSALQSVTSTGTVGYQLTYTGASSLPTWQPAGGGAGSGIVVQQIRGSTTAQSTYIKALSATATTPTTANTASIITATITPLNASNVLDFDFSVPCSVGANDDIVLHLFSGTTFLKSFPQTSVAGYYTIIGAYYAVAGSTATVTYDVRGSSVAGQTIYINSALGSNFSNSATSTSVQLRITEVTP